jgi:hypothetical protein
MGRELKLLERVEIASPCKADWSKMTGDERVRFCGLCRLNVYNLSGMKRAEAEELLKKSEGKVCVRLWKRADGTVLTQDCPFAVKVARRVKRVAIVAASALAAAIGIGASLFRPRHDVVMGSVCPVRPTQPLMGKPAMPRDPAEMGMLKRRDPEPDKLIMGEPSIAPESSR